MSNKKNLFQLLFLTALLFQLSFQQSNNFLSNIIQNADEATVGHGNQGVVITNEGGNTLDDSLFHFQSIELEGLSSDEWTVHWIDNEGEAFDLIDENGLIIAVGPDNSTEDVTNQLASAASIPAASVSGLIGTLTEDLVQEIDKSGGNETLTGNQVYSKAILPVSLAVLGAQAGANSVASNLDEAGNAISQAASDGASDVKDAAESAGNSIKDAAQNVGDKAGDVASDAWQNTKDAANTVADKASDIGSDIADKATEFGESVSDAAKDTWEDTKNAAETVGDKAQEIGNTIADKASDAANTVADKATDFGESVSDGAQTAWNQTKDVADKVGDAVGNAFDSLKDGISNLFGN